MKEKLHAFDFKFISWAQKNMLWFARIALFVVYFWFGILKVFGLSPAGELVHALFDKTIHFMPFGTFYTLFALFEVVIGILFLIPKFTRVAIFLLFLHLITTTMPLILLANMIWTHPFVPTLEGQYIIKNILIIGLALVLVANTKPIREINNNKQ